MNDGDILTISTTDENKNLSGDILEKIKGKDVDIVITSYSIHYTKLYEGAGADTVVKYIRDIFKHWGFNKVHTLGLTVYSSSGYVPKGRVLEKSNKIATEFYNDVKNKKLYSPTLKRLMYFNAWRAINEKGSQADCQYWIDTKFNENSFSPDVKIGFLKKSIGNILFKIIKKNMPK